MKGKVFVKIRIDFSDIGNFLRRTQDFPAGRGGEEERERGCQRFQNVLIPEM